MEPVTIYGRPGCGFCVRARELCESRGYSHRFIDIIAEGMSKADLADRIGKPVHTVPQIFVGEAHVGGFDEFSALVAATDSSAVGSALH